MKGLAERHRRWHAARHRVGHSIGARLVLLYLVLALAIGSVFLFGMSRMFKSGWQIWAKPLTADYVDRLVAELGTPPDGQKAQALVARLPITLRIDGPTLHFDSHPALHARLTTGYGPDQAAEAWGLVRTTADGHHVRFGLAKPPDADRPRQLGWITLAALLLLTALAYGVTRRMLRPLAEIGDGVSRYARADFAQPIAVRRRDELGDLAGRVNAMARSLQGMLEDKRALLLAISHELRSPLTRARLNAELVDDGPAKTALLQDLAAMRDLISDLLESERIAAGAPALQLEAVDLPVWLQAQVARLQGQRPEAPPLTLELQPSAGPMRVDATRLALLLRNLVDNAWRHGLAEGGPPPQVFLRSEPDGRLTLGVRDHGPGVPEDQAARLAEAFYRPDSARTRAAGGVGLGLYLCRLVAQAHGGELRIRRAEPGLEVAMVWMPLR